MQKLIHLPREPESMFLSIHLKRLLLVFTFFSIYIVPPIHTQDSLIEEHDEDLSVPYVKIIQDIQVINNKQIPTEAILDKIPYSIGDYFNEHRAAKIIKALFDFDHFSNITIRGKDAPNNSVILYIIVQEDPPISKVVYKGNKHVTNTEIEKKLKISDLPTANINKLNAYARGIKKLLAEKGYHDAVVEPNIQINPDATATVIFLITENQLSRVQRVFFEGNKALSTKKLRTILYTKEDWLLSFLDKAGTYQPELLAADKYKIEELYQNYGYLAAQVTDVKVEKIANTSNYAVTFVIDEGDLYTIESVHIPGNELMSEEQLKARINLRSGMLYSREAIRATLESLRYIWGEFGYINAEVIPLVEPNLTTKTVAITFETELGEKVTIGRILISGNRKTRDNVIRRQITLTEGDTVTTQGLERSKYRIESLGFFNQRNGVSYRIRRTSPEVADIEFMVNEIKTGRAFAQIGFNGSPRDLTSPSQALKVGATIADTNTLGTGIATSLETSIAKDERSAKFNATNPWLFNRPITGALDLLYRHTEYEEIKTLKIVPKEHLISGALTLGYLSRLVPDMRILFQTGLESIHYSTPIEVEINDPEKKKFKKEIEILLQQRFEAGQVAWLAATLGKDERNNPVHPTRGYQWSLTSKLGLPFIDEKFGFFKFEADGTWYTPLIGEYNLIFMVHGHLGIIEPLSSFSIPYRELFHIGGPASVRGFTFGQISPHILRDSIGGTKALFFNTELIFPVTPDFSIKGALFYDGGAGWDTPRAHCISSKLLRDNHFDYRHSIGVSVRMTQPTPVRIDIGFKLDRRKGEKPFEVHLTALREF